MNEPLRLSGWTLYQMSWGQDSLHPGRLISILRASHNPLEQMPKWSSYIIAIGLLWHFACVLADTCAANPVWHLPERRRRLNRRPLPPPAGKTFASGRHLPAGSGNLRRRHAGSASCRPSCSGEKLCALVSRFGGTGRGHGRPGRRPPEAGFYLCGVPSAPDAGQKKLCC